jgi:hypothetical protein
VPLSGAGRKEIPPTLALPLEGGGLGGGEIAVSFKIIIICKDIYYVCISCVL